MISDLYFTEDGDISVSTSGDVGVTSSTQEFLSQQARLRLATRRGDFLPYPRLGADLQRLVGLPNTPRTARFGADLIYKNLTYDGFMQPGRVKVDATPLRPDLIEFEVQLASGTKERIVLTLSQLLTI